METVGIIGTGEMGWRMARLLVDAGHTVVAYDIDADALALAEKAGAEPAPDIATVAAKVDVVITCVTDGDALSAVIEGPGGLLESLDAGKTVIDTTSAEPWISKDLGEQLISKGVDFLDAPVSGGVPAAEAGRMNFMVGGDTAVLDRWRPLMLRMGPVIHHVGDISAGHTVKAINMLTMAASMLATAEVLAAGQAAGVPPEALIDVLNTSSGGSYVTLNHFPKFILPGTYDSGFTFDLMYKDLGIGIELARRLGLTLFGGSRTWEIYEAAARTGLKGKDNTCICDLIFKPQPSNAFPGAGDEDAFIDADRKLERIGFIGLGAMGSRMTARLLDKGVVPTVFDLDAGAMKEAVAKGAVATDSPAAVAAACDIVLLSLPDSAIVDTVFFGSGGILEGIGEDGPAPVLLDTSSSKAETSRKMGAALRSRGGDMLDVPVSRGQPAATNGTLSIMIGGSAATLEKCRWVLDLLGTDLIHVAGLGTGHATKALNNLVNTANVIAAGEALLMAAAAGLDPHVVADVLCASSGASEILSGRFIPYVLTGTFNSNFRMGLMSKDATYGLELCGAARVPSMMTANAVQIYAGALAEHGPEADNTELIKFLAKWVGGTLPGILD